MFFECGGALWQLDPNNALKEFSKLYEGEYPKNLMMFVGMIPTLITPKCKDFNNADDVFNEIEGNYGFPRTPMKGEIKNGIYYSEFSEDEPLLPIAKLFNYQVSVFIYEYGIVGIKCNKKTIIARFD